MKNNPILMELLNQYYMELLNQYYAVWQECNYVYGEWAKAHGLSVNSLLVLSAIAEGGANCTQRKISQRWLIPKQTVNMVLKELQQKGFVEMVPVQEDKRNKQIRFTPAGSEYADGILSELRKVELYAIGKMGIEQMKQMNDSMALFVSLFGKAGGKKDDETTK